MENDKFDYSFSKIRETHEIHYLNRQIVWLNVIKSSVVNYF